MHGGRNSGGRKHGLSPAREYLCPLAQTSQRLSKPGTRSRGDVRPDGTRSPREGELGLYVQTLALPELLCLLLDSAALTISVRTKLSPLKWERSGIQWLRWVKGSDTYRLPQPSDPADAARAPTGVRSAGEGAGTAETPGSASVVPAAPAGSSPGHRRRGQGPWKRIACSERYLSFPAQTQTCAV